MSQRRVCRLEKVWPRSVYVFVGSLLGDEMNHAWVWNILRLAYCLYCTLHRGCIRLLVVSLLGLSGPENLLTIQLRSGIWMFDDQFKYFHDATVEAYYFSIQLFNKLYQIILSKHNCKALELCDKQLVCFVTSSFRQSHLATNGETRITHHILIGWA